MEGSAFDAAAPAASQDDPFGESGEGDFRQESDPFAEAPAPRVDREGNPIEDAPLASAEEEAELAAAQEAAEEAGVDAATAVESSVAEGDGVGVDMARQEVAAERAEQPKPEPDAADAADLNGAAVGEAEVAQPDPPSAPTDGAETASSAASSESTAEGSADDLNGAQVPAEGSPAAATADGSPAGDAQSAAEEAEAPKAKKGLRAYRLFVPEGNGKFVELSWLEDKAGKLVKAGTPGAKKQTVVLTREQDGALHHGFAVLGSPEGGAKLVAVADSQWTVRHVEPDPVQPVRQRLRIK